MPAGDMTAFQLPCVEQAECSEDLLLSELPGWQRQSGICTTLLPTLGSASGIGAVLQIVADHLRVRLHTPLVCLLSRQDESFQLLAVTAENPQLAGAVWSSHYGKGLRYSTDLARRALAAGEPITVSIDPSTHVLADLIPAGTLIAAPFHTSQAEGAALVYPRPGGNFTPEEKSLIHALLEFGAALASSPIGGYMHGSGPDSSRSPSATAWAVDLHSWLPLPDFGRRLVLQAAAIMAAQSGFLALKQDATLEVSFLFSAIGPTSDQGLRERLARALPQLLSQHPEPIISGNAAELFGEALDSFFGAEDCTVVRLTGRLGKPVGALCLADRQKPLTARDRQLLQTIAAHASIALENALLFSRMEGANRHWIEIFDAISDFIVAHDESNRVSRVNRSFADFIGVPPKELIRMNMPDLLAGNGARPPEDSCPFCRGRNDEYLHPLLDRTFLVSTSRVGGANSDGMQTVHVLKDITDRREAERRYRELFDSIQEGLFFATPDGHFVEVNDSLVRMLGYGSREQLLQADVSAQVYRSPEAYQHFAEQMAQAGLIRNREETLRRLDGSPVFVLINAVAVRDSQGRIVQYRGLMLDITELKSFQTELQRERDFSGKILSHTQSLILVADTAGLISYANRRWHEMGYEQNQLLGLPLEQLTAPSRRDALREALSAISSGRQVDNLDLQILRGDGNVRQFSVNLSPMRDEQGNVISLIVVMSDVTDAATLQAKLVHAEKMAAVGQLVSGVAHEVNNPLTAILGFSDLLLENPELPESARKDLRVIQQEAQRTKQIVQNLLSVARQTPPQRKPVQLNLILRRTVQLRAYDFQSHGVEVIERFDPDLPNVMGDSHQLQQVFLNILNNAYDAVREAGLAARIEITTARRAAFVEVSFRDNGHGISYPERVFDPFFTTKEVGKGTGLGLSICYGIVRGHGGEIACHNNADGRGATFVVRFPVVIEIAPVNATAGVLQP
jgi:PAS domain S-box-containing protein